MVTRAYGYFGCALLMLAACGTSKSGGSDAGDAADANDVTEASAVDAADSAAADSNATDSARKDSADADADAVDGVASDVDAADGDATGDVDAGDALDADAAHVDATDVGDSESGATDVASDTPIADTVLDIEAGPPGGTVTRTSCATTTTTDLTCTIGASSVSCCEATAVPTGTFLRDEQSGTPATIYPFSLDVLEVTVGRFRRFVDRWRNHAWRPQDGTGAPPTGAGWSSAWDSDVELAAPEAGVGPLICDVDNATWSETVGNIENEPINCVNWFEAFAFCVWDGGRLPTEAEWEYAAAGGSAQRLYPWGNNAPTTVYASWSPDFLVVVGAHPSGHALWGHQDLAGNVAELVYDVYASYPSSCLECANGFGDGGIGDGAPDAGPTVVNRGGSFQTALSYLQTNTRAYATPLTRSAGIGFRCAH